ncbi:HAMP domain-containing sensor histidine kinase [Bacillus spongiae]|uniref:histidine kinase n=1 Tax=Bacillus spongiae TaxID=2683610 RepID=A0ABU8HBU5_9BACI
MKHLHNLRRSIVFKIFSITTAMLIIASFVIFFALYYLLPDFYKDMKMTQLRSNLQELVDKSEGGSLDDFVSLIGSFERENLVIVNVYTPDKKYKLQQNSVYEIKLVDDIEINNVRQDVSLEEGDFLVEVTQTLQSVEEAQTAILRFFPYMVVIIFLIALIGSFFYARMLSRPLLELNEVSKKMINLDFSVKSNYLSKDELGELGRNLNTMSNNLQAVMTDLHKANEKLKEDIEHERKLEAERKDLFAAISHELKSPITVVKGQLEGMLYNIGVYKDRDTYLKRSFKSVEELEGLVREILYLSKIDRVGFNPVFQEINMSNMLTNIIQSFHYFASEKQLKVTVKMEEEYLVYTDRMLLDKSLRNIIHNAMMYSPEGAEVILSCTQDQSTIQIDVFNSDVVIEDDQLKDLFEPFKRVEKSRNKHTGGSGLGLHLVKRIFTVLHIDYHLKNENNGVLFTIKIPKGQRESI